MGREGHAWQDSAGMISGEDVRETMGILSS